MGVLLQALLFALLFAGACGPGELGPRTAHERDSHAPDIGRKFPNFPPSIPQPRPDYGTPVVVKLPAYLPAYKPLREMFQEESAIMQSSETASTLGKLRQIASPTPNYHDDLMRQIQSAKTTDMAHIKMLLEAVYYPYQRELTMKEEYRRLAEAGEIHSEQFSRLRTERTLAGALSPTLATIVSIGFPKATDFSWNTAIECLNLLYPRGNAATAFQFISKFAAPLNDEQKNTLMLLASAKNETEIASDFAIEQFKSTDKSLSALFSLVDKLQYFAKDRTMQKGLEFFPSLTHEQVLQFVKREFARNGQVAADAYGKSQEKTHAHATEITKMLPESAHDFFVSSTLAGYKALSTQEMTELCDLAHATCASIAKRGSEIWSDPKPEQATVLAERLNYNDKDTWLVATAKYFTSVTTKQLSALLEAAYQAKLPIAKALVANISDFDAKKAATMAEHFSYNDKDTWLEIAQKAIKSADAQSLVDYVNAGYLKKLELAQGLYPKLSPKKASAIVAVAETLSYNDKDQWLDFALTEIPKLTTEEYKTVIGAAYLKATELAQKHIARLSDLSAPGAVKIAELLSYAGKDTWLAAVGEKLSALTTKELGALLEAAYLAKLNLALNLLAKVSDLSPKGAASIADAGLSYDARDKWLAKAVERFASVASAEVHELLEAAYLQRGSLSLALLPKIRDLTVANAAKIAEDLSYADKDNFLLQAVDAVTDLKPSNIEVLTEAAYLKRDEIKKKAQARFSKLFA